MANKKITPITRMVVYKTTNLANGKIYIGQDSKNNPKYLGSGVILLKAIKKYGSVSFKKEVIDTAVTINELNKKEIFWISEYNSRDPKIGYNLTAGGDSVIGVKHTEEIKKILLKRSEKVKKEGTHKGKNNGRFKYDITKEALYDLYITKNKKIDEISSYYGCHRTIITKKLKAFSINKPLSNKYGFKTDIVYKYYMIDNLSLAAIAKIYGCSNKTIFKIVKKHGWVNDKTIKFVRPSKFGLTYDNLYKNYCLNKLSKTEISKIHKCSIQLINYTLRKYSLK